MKAIIEQLGSKRLTLTVLKTGILVPSILTILWILDVRPPAFYMVWLPLTVWGIVFLVNLVASLFTQRYIHRANLFFHIAFLIVAMGISISLLYRFEGEAIVVEDGLFMGDEREYLRHNAGQSFSGVAPSGVGFYVESIEPVFWQDRLYFTGLKAVVSYPPHTRSHTAEIELNGGPSIGGARLRLTGYGIFPEVIIKKGDDIVLKDVLRVNVFPPGNEDYIELGGYRLHMRLYPDYYTDEEGRPSTRSMYIKEPALLVRVEWLSNTVYEGVLRQGESVRFMDTRLTFSGTRRFVMVGVVRDPGEWLVFSGFVLAGASLLLRLKERRAKKG